MLAHFRQMPRWLSLLGGVGICLMMLLTTLDVAGKYLLNRPIPGVAEIIASYFMISAVFLPLADTEKRGEPIAVDLFYERMPLGGRLLCNLLGIVLTAVFYGVMAWQNMQVALDAYAIGEYVSGAWDVVIWPSKFLIPLGLACAFAVLAWRIAHLRQISTAAEDHKDPA